MFIVVYLMTLGFLTAFFICLLKMAKQICKLNDRFTKLEDQYWKVDNNIRITSANMQLFMNKWSDFESMLKETDQGVQFLIDLEEEFQKEKEEKCPQTK